MIRRAARQLKDGAKLSDLNSGFERVNLNTTVSPPQTRYCNAWRGGEDVTAESENVSIWYRGPSCLLFSMFQLA